VVLTNDFEMHELQTNSGTLITNDQLLLLKIKNFELLFKLELVTGLLLEWISCFFSSNKTAKCLN
jgi:hypothetical protein